jgi:tetratricopeptide (TPR) repeat protein/predicted Ser/Thr protein kinase
MSVPRDDARTHQGGEDADAADLDARADALFAEALDLPDEDRARLIDSRAASDPALRAAVEQLLELAATPAAAFDAVMEADASRHARVRSAPSSSSAITSDPADGQRIGAWRVVRRIGHGGMGTVFLVERADGQYEQRGALKLVHAHAAAADAHQRFARERRILASLDHAHVARLLDGGQTDDGRLYFVMEYVEGRPIDRFCDETRATIDRRLELFLKVCAGVQHAHDRLVVHRDLKPSNILVTDAGDVKLLDFGIAKLLSDDAAAPATRLLTPEYASPEQWRGDPVAIASDVYQLGLLLYELLTGQPAQSLSGGVSGVSGTPRSFERIVCDTLPAQPSTRVKTADPSIAAARRISRPALARTLSGDLDNITLFALRKEPGRRYASVRDLADDVQRHRAGRPVRARGDDVLYRIGKFAGRHRIAVAIAAVALAAVTVAMALIAGERWRTAREAAYAERVEDMVVELFSLPQPGVQQGPPRAKDYVDQAVALVRTQFQGQPERLGRLLGQLGRAYSALGHYETAIDVLRQAVSLREAHGGTGQAGLAQALEWLGQVEIYAGRYAQAEASLRRALLIRQTETGATAAATTWSMLELGDLLHTQGRLPEAEQMLSGAIPILRTQPATIPLARALTDFGNVLRDRGRLGDAEASYRESLALFRKVLPARTAQIPLTEIYLSRLLIMRGGPGDLAAADTMLTTNLATLRGMFEDEHPLTALALKELGYLRTEQGRYAEADATLKESQVVIARWLGANHPQAPRARVHQAEAARRQGRAAEAFELATRALDELTALGLTDHPAAIDARLVIGEALLSERRTPEALSILNDGLARAERQFVQGDARTARFRSAVSRAR